MHPVRAAVLAAAFFALLPARGSALDPQKSITQYAHQVWKTDAGLPQLLARYGGEEFAAILPSTPLRGAAAVAEILRGRVESMATRHSGAPTGVVTISLGVATAPPGSASSPEALAAAADEALYRAKRAGRNRVESGPGVSVPEPRTTVG